MPRNRDDWQTRIRSIERQFSAVQFAVNELLAKVVRDPTILHRSLDPRDIREASKELEATYLVRLFAEFESGLRSFWQSVRPGRHPRTEHLLEGVASHTYAPNEWLAAAHGVREYRNDLVHEKEEEVTTFSMAEARGHLCRFFSRLPITW